MPSGGPLLSAAVVVGSQRRRAQRSVLAACRQTAIDSIEVIVVDLAPPGPPDLETPPGVAVTYRRVAEARLWTWGRAEAARLARAPVVAYLEDHCYASPGWAEALIERHREPWAAVGYAFTNANPETWVSRRAMINDYGYWMHPAPSGPQRLLPGNNVSYKRELLLSFGDRLERVLTPDFSLQEIFRSRGLPMCTEPRALAAHENWPTLSSLLRAGYTYGRALGAGRARTQSWGRPRRLFYGCVSPLSAPLFGAVRLLRRLPGRPPEVVRLTLAGLPIYLLAHFAAGIGEGWGYLTGKGPGEEALDYCEIGAPHTTIG
jgi:hypothetical protein